MKTARWPALSLLLSTALLPAACSHVPLVPAGPPAQVTLTPRNPHRLYVVRVVDAAGGSSECRAPCTVSPASGTAQVFVTGDATFNVRAVVPPGPSRAEIRRRNLGALIATYSLSGVGFVTTLASQVGETTQQILLIGGTGVGLCVGGVIASFFIGKDDVHFEAEPPAKQVRLAPLLAPTAGGAVAGASLRF